MTPKKRIEIIMVEKLTPEKKIPTNNPKEKNRDNNNREINPGLKNAKEIKVDYITNALLI